MGSDRIFANAPVGLVVLFPFEICLYTYTSDDPAKFMPRLFLVRTYYSSTVITRTRFFMLARNVRRRFSFNREKTDQNRNRWRRYNPMRVFELEYHRRVVLIAARCNNNNSALHTSDTKRENRRLSGAGIRRLQFKTRAVYCVLKETAVEFTTRVQKSRARTRHVGKRTLYRRRDVYDV